jgi:hypothetical protein
MSKGGQATTTADIATNTATIATNSAALTDLEVTSTVHYNYFTASDGQDNGAINDRTLTFNKQSNASLVLVTWYDNFRTYNHDRACRWEIYLNGLACSAPERIFGDNYIAGAVINNHRLGVITGICETAGSDPLNSGTVTITGRVGPTPGHSGSDCYTGWDNQPSFLMAQELVF